MDLGTGSIATESGESFLLFDPALVDPILDLIQGSHTGPHGLFEGVELGAHGLGFAE